LPTIFTSPCAEWMLNSYRKYVEPTKSDINWYFKQKEQKRKDKENAIS
jgi:hypothetical protein